MISTLPKAELHCHIEGAAPVFLAKQQAEKYGINIAHILQNDHYKWHDFTSFITAYDTVANLFQTPQDYAALAESYFKSIADQGAIYGEIFISPDHAETAGLAPEAYIEALAEGMARAEDQYGIVSRMIIVGVRHMGVASVEKAAKLAASKVHPWVTGFGMAGEERFGHMSEFAPAFDIAREAGLGITVHAGELCGYQSVVDALDHIKPSRIGHGVRSIEDPKTVERLASTGTVLEICPGSNVALDIFPSWSEHPFQKLEEARVTVTISSDDPPHFKTSLGNDYQMVAQTFGYDDQAMLRFTQNALKAAFVDEDMRQKLLAKSKDLSQK